jgi:hypothetical protein
MDRNIIDLDGEGINKKPSEKTIKPAPKTGKPESSLKDRVNALLSPKYSDYYSFLLPSGKEISMRPSLFEDERLAAIEAKQTGISIFQALEKRVIKDIDPSTLPYFDELYILLKLRQISFGPEIKLLPIKCSSCGKENDNLQINVDNLNVNRADPPIESLTLEVKLPVTGHTALVRIPTIADNDKSDSEDNLSDLVLKIAEEKDTYVLRAVVDKLPSGDIKSY